MGGTKRTLMKHPMHIPYDYNPSVSFTAMLDALPAGDQRARDVGDELVAEARGEETVCGKVGLCAGEEGACGAGDGGREHEVEEEEGGGETGQIVAPWGGRVCWGDSRCGWGRMRVWVLGVGGIGWLWRWWRDTGARGG